MSQCGMVRPHFASYSTSYAPSHGDHILRLPREVLLLISDFLDAKSHSVFSRTYWRLIFHLQRHLFARWSTQGDYQAVNYACGAWRVGKFHSEVARVSGCVDIWQAEKLPAIERALSYGMPPDLDAVVHKGQTSLAVAASKECPYAVAYLLDNNAEVDNPGDTGLTPLAYALEALGENHRVDSLEWVVLHGDHSVSPQPRSRPQVCATRESTEHARSVPERSRGPDCDSRRLPGRSHNRISR